MTAPRLLPKGRLDDLLRLLVADGFEVVGPRVEQDAITYGPIGSAAGLPVGWTDRQGPGTYRLERRGDDAYFGYAVGPHSWKKYLFPPRLTLWQARRTADGFAVQADVAPPPRRAFLGVRACELHAIAVQDRVFLDRAGRFTDPHYAAARSRLFLIGVECEHPADTCFCASMGTGPGIDPGRLPPPAEQPAETPCNRVPLPMAADAPPARPACDLVLTELDDAFVVRATSPAGQDVLDRLDLSPAGEDRQADARRRVDAAAARMAHGRHVETAGIRDLLHANQDHPRWDDVARRCLACTNCTLVCPTCFCSAVEDTADVALETAARTRRWDSCFTPDFGRVHGGNFRASVRGRYRQWLTHKFASWLDQFSTSGCVGCGRCIAWCPVGIDVTEELAAIRGGGEDNP